MPEIDNADRVASATEQAEKRTEETRGFMRSVRRATRRKYTPEEKIRIVLEGFRREATVNDLCRREGINPANYYPSSSSGRRSWTRDPSTGAGRGSWKPVRKGLLATRYGVPHESRSSSSIARTES